MNIIKKHDAIQNFTTENGLEHKMAPKLSLQSRFMIVGLWTCLTPYRHRPVRRGVRGVRSNPPFSVATPTFDDHFQQKSRPVHCTLDVMHVPMLIVQNCTRLYCLDLAYQC